MKRSAAEILHEYGPFPDADRVHGVTFDGRHVWFASDDRLNAFDPASGKTVRLIRPNALVGGLLASFELAPGVTLVNQRI